MGTFSEEDTLSFILRSPYITWSCSCRWCPWFEFAVMLYISHCYSPSCSLLTVEKFLVLSFSQLYCLSSPPYCTVLHCYTYSPSPSTVWWIWRCPWSCPCPSCTVWTLYHIIKYHYSPNPSMVNLAMSLALSLSQLYCLTSSYWAIPQSEYLRMRFQLYRTYICMYIYMYRDVTIQFTRFWKGCNPQKDF